MNNRYAIYLPGVLFIGMSLMITAFPGILVVLFASLIGAMGGSLLYLGYLIRKYRIQPVRVETRDDETGFVHIHFERIPAYRFSSHR